MAKFTNLPTFPENTGGYFDQGSVTPERLGTPVTEVQQGDVPEAIVSDTESGTTVTKRKEDIAQENKEKEKKAEVRRDIKSRFGVNLSVADSKGLEKIDFIDGSSGGMQGALAYIRYWSRSGTEQRTPVKEDPVSDENTTGQVSETAEKREQLDVEPPPPPLPNAFPAPQESSPQPSTPPIPVNTQSVPNPGREGLLQKNRNQQKPKPKPKPKETGPVYSANPGKVAPKSNTESKQGVIFDESLPGKWQFLFNPEELQLESGPDYNKAETWGVSDPANSGQPLSWRSNKNRRLTFGKVLLTGYVIGKRVDNLEKGLQELFMARDGENGADGPPVLEFVWGSRVFGPCVIQDIRVNEKAWDNGVLVNAEVSFSLEQVPEWTINDGFVDIARPGRQPTIDDPTLPKPPVEGEKPAEAPPGGAGSTPGGGGGTSRANSATAQQCKMARKDLGITSNFFDKVNKKYKSKEESETLVGEFGLGSVKVLRYSPGFLSYLDNPDYANDYTGIIRRSELISSIFNGKINGTTIGQECTLSSFSRDKKDFESKIKSASDTYKFNNNQKILEFKKIDDVYLLKLLKCSAKVKKIQETEIKNKCANVK